MIFAYSFKYYLRQLLPHPLTVNCILFYFFLLFSVCVSVYLFLANVQRIVTKNYLYCDIFSRFSLIKNRMPQLYCFAYVCVCIYIYVGMCKRTMYRGKSTFLPTIHLMKIKFIFIFHILVTAFCCSANKFHALGSN